MKILFGPTFGAELVAKGCQDGLAWSSEGIITDPSLITAAQQAVIVAHDPTKVDVHAQIAALEATMSGAPHEIIHDMFGFSAVPDHAASTAVMVHVLDHLLDAAGEIMIAAAYLQSWDSDSSV